MDNKSNTGSPDRDRVNLNEDYEVQYWTKKFGITKQQLEAAVKAVGTAAADVEKHLKS